MEDCEGYILDDWLLPAAGEILLDVHSWSFDGYFQKKSARLPIHRLPSVSHPFNIKDMTIYPIHFADESVRKALRARGQMFWKCRRQNYVSYGGDLDARIQSSVSSRIVTWKIINFKIRLIRGS